VVDPCRIETQKEAAAGITFYTQTHDILYNRSRRIFPDRNLFPVLNFFDFNFAVDKPVNISDDDGALNIEEREARDGARRVQQVRMIGGRSLVMGLKVRKGVRIGEIRITVLLLSVIEIARGFVLLVIRVGEGFGGVGRRGGGGGAIGTLRLCLHPPRSSTCCCRKLRRLEGGGMGG